MIGSQIYLTMNIPEGWCRGRRSAKPTPRTEVYERGGGFSPALSSMEAGGCAYALGIRSCIHMPHSLGWARRSAIGVHHSIHTRIESSTPIYTCDTSCGNFVSGRGTRRRRLLPALAGSRPSAAMRAAQASSRCRRRPIGACLPAFLVPADWTPRRGCSMLAD